MLEKLIILTTLTVATLGAGSGLAHATDDIARGPKPPPPPTVPVDRLAPSTEPLQAGVAVCKGAFGCWILRAVCRGVDGNWIEFESEDGQVHGMCSTV